jgi:SRSO17 transposase
MRALDKRLREYLETVTAGMDRKEQKHWAGFYLRGLLLDGQRKSIEPMASRVGADAQNLQQFIGQSTWSEKRVQKTLNGFMNGQVSGPAYWIVDETSFPKQGKHSVGVARQYCGALGKKANCQVSVSLHWRNEQVGWPVGWRLYLPESWALDKKRRKKAGVPEEVVFAPKTDLALELIDSARRQGLQVGTVLADCAYGGSYEWRRQLRDWGLSYCVEVEGDTAVWPDAVWQKQRQGGKLGRPRQNPPRESIVNLKELAQQLPALAWQTVTWREGTKGAMSSRFALTPVWASCRKGSGQQERWLEYALIEWPQDQPAPRKYWLSWWQGQAPTLEQAVPAAKNRWPIEQDYRELKDELGLDHFEGRSWLGWHHHVAMVTLAFAFLQLEKQRAKKKPRSDTTDDSPSDGAALDPVNRLLPLVPDSLRTSIQRQFLR